MPQTTSPETLIERDRSPQVSVRGSPAESLINVAPVQTAPSSENVTEETQEKFMMIIENTKKTARNPVEKQALEAQSFLTSRPRMGGPGKMTLPKIDTQSLEIATETQTLTSNQFIFTIPKSALQGPTSPLQQLYAKEFIPKDGQKITAVMIIVHALGQHHGTFYQMANRFRKQYGIYVVAFDQRGHGKNITDNGQMPGVSRIQSMVNDLSRVIEFADKRIGTIDPGIRASNPNLPFVLFGHSMGSLVCLSYIIQNGKTPPVNGLILSAPALEMNDKIKISPQQFDSIKKITTKTPRVKKNLNLFGANGATKKVKNEDGTFRIETDDLVHGMMGLELIVDMHEYSQDLRERWADVPHEISLLVIQPTADLTVQKEVGKAFYDSVDIATKQYIEVPDKAHHWFLQAGDGVEAAIQEIGLFTRDLNEWRSAKL